MEASEPTRALRRDPGFFGASSAYVLFCAVATLYVASQFYDSVRLQTLYAEYWTEPKSFEQGSLTRTHGPWSAPLDDVFIHFDFARSAARGRPFEWAPGTGYSSGGTSLLYPFVLAAGFHLGFTGLEIMEWAAVVACVSVLSLLLSARRVFRGLPAWAAYLAPPAILGIGALSWSLFSGMEVALFLALWGGAFVLWEHLDLDRDAPLPRLFGRALALGGVGALLVATRPESIATLLVFAASVAFILRRRGLVVVAAAAALVVAPCALVVLGQGLANLILTGDFAAAGAVAKLEIYHPFLTSDEKLDAWLFYLSYQLLRVTQYHLQSLPVIGWAVWVFALLALAFPDTRKRALLLLGCVVTWAMMVAMNGQVRWQNERYAMPAVAWLMLAAALGLAGVLTRAWEAPRSKPRLAAAAAALAVTGFFAWQAVPNFRAQVWFFGRGARNIYDQQVTVGKVLRAGLKPPPRLVLLSDAGAIPFMTDAPALDLIGLGGFQRMPFARATRSSIGAALELIEHLEPSRRPDVFALYPSWWSDLPLWFGRRIGEVPARGNVMCGAPSKVLYRAEWAPLEHSSLPFDLRPGERVVGELDWADILSEQAAGYRRIPEAPGRIAMKILAHPRKPALDVFDAGRYTPPGRRELFELRDLPAGRPLRLVVRAAPVDPVSVPVLVAGRRVGTFDLPKADSWVESSVELGPTPGGTLAIELGASDDRVLYHLWAIESP